MHALSLAQSIIGMIGDDARERGFTLVSQVTIKVGEWSAVQPDSLTASFEVLASLEGPLFDTTVLTIQEEPARGECPACGSAFPVGAAGLTCPHPPEGRGEGPPPTSPACGTPSAAV